MTGDTGHQDQSHFPEDREAPVIKSSFAEFYESHEKVIDFTLFALISAMTLVTVSFSIYIISVKYF